MWLQRLLYSLLIFSRRFSRCILGSGLLPQCLLPMASLDVQKLGKPGVFEGDDAHWPAWSFVMRGYVQLLGLFTYTELHQAEHRPEAIELSTLSAQVKEKSAILWYVLTFHTAAESTTPWRREGC